jgi:hypothetical protein
VLHQEWLSSWMINYVPCLCHKVPIRYTYKLPERVNVILEILTTPNLRTATPVTPLFIARHNFTSAMLVLQITFVLIDHFTFGVRKIQQMAQEPVSQLLLVG